MTPGVGDRTTESCTSLALEGIRVIECGQGISAAFAAKLLGLLGAEVIKVEPPQGDLTRTQGRSQATSPIQTRARFFSTSMPTSPAWSWT